jgi:hypothetical protein
MPWGIIYACLFLSFLLPAFVPAASLSLVSKKNGVDVVVAAKSHSGVESWLRGVCTFWRSETDRRLVVVVAE